MIDRLKRSAILPCVAIGVALAQPAAALSYDEAVQGDVISRDLGALGPGDTLLSGDIECIRDTATGSGPFSGFTCERGIFGAPSDAGDRFLFTVRPGQSVTAVTLEVIGGTFDESGILDISLFDGDPSVALTTPVFRVIDGDLGAPLPNLLAAPLETGTYRADIFTFAAPPGAASGATTAFDYRLTLTVEETPAIPLPAIPLPAGLPLMAAALGGLALIRWRG